MIPIVNYVDDGLADGDEIANAVGCQIDTF